jgi:3-methyladenine DNA glycosylase AlkC
MDRLRRTSVAVEESLAGSCRRKIGVLQKLAPTIKHGFVGIFLSDFVAQYGLHTPEFSLEALRGFTRFGSAEFAVRPFIVQDQEKTLATMLRWASDADDHVRRLSSEGCRPRLPWGQRLHALVRDPAPLAPILTSLKSDPSLYVRKSVANNLNDISRDHPDWMLARLSAWDLSHSHTSWIAKRAARTLIKKGHAPALALFGFGRRAAVSASLMANPARLKPGGILTLTATITSASKKPQRLAVDYLIHYVKSGGGTSPKVFKWSETEIPAGEVLTLTKRQTIRDFTTRKHFPGRHEIELQINGQRVARTAFFLLTGAGG